MDNKTPPPKSSPPEAKTSPEAPKQETHSRPNPVPHQRPKAFKRHSDDFRIPKKQRMNDGSANSVNVTNHYNQLKSQSRDARKESKIFYMRNFNNAIKSLLIKKYLDLVKRMNFHPVVLDLAAGKGGDLLKWRNGRISRVHCTDIAGTSIENAEMRYKSQRMPFKADFSVCDASKEDLLDKLPDDSLKFDLTSCQFAIHYSFESEKQAHRMVKNACQSLKEGGYFIGTTVNSTMLRERLLSADTDKLKFGNSLYSVEFDSKEKFSDFGCKYMFKLTDVVDCPEFVLDKNIFVDICAQYGMKLLEWKSFERVFWENEKERESYRLIKKMRALEIYNKNRQYFNSPVEGDYEHAEEAIREREERYPGSNASFLTLSKSEWQVSSIYVAFAFVKDSTYRHDKNSPNVGVHINSAANHERGVPLMIM